MKYDEKWPDLNREKEAAIARGDEKGAKRARQKLSALSVVYNERFVVEPEPPTLEDRIEWLEDRVAALERG